MGIEADLIHARNTGNGIPEIFDRAVGEINRLNVSLAKSHASSGNFRKALQKIADIKHEDIPKPTTPNEAIMWTVLAMAVEIAEIALKEAEDEKETRA